MKAMTWRRAAIVAAALGVAVPAHAQLDPLQFIKLYPPNVVVAVDVSSRMQRDVPTDNTDINTWRATSNYYDPYIYSRTGAAWETTLGVPPGSSTYRRLYKNIVPGSSDKFNASTISITASTSAASYTNFEAPTRLSILRAALYQAIVENNRVARFSLVRMRQKTPAPATLLNTGPVAVSDPLELTPTDQNSATGRWGISRPTIANGTTNGTQSAPSPVAVVQGDTWPTANTNLMTGLTRDPRQADGNTAATFTLLPAGNDDGGAVDAPVNNLLTDAKSEATRLMTLNDPSCRNTVVVLIVGGGEGTTSGVNNSALASTAAGFTSISGRRVPVYVIAIAPPATDRAGLQAIATTTGGMYVEITARQVQAALSAQSSVYPSSLTGTVIVPEVVAAIDTAVAHAYATSTDFNTFNASNATRPLGGVSEFQTVAPITGTVDLLNARDINGSALPNTQVTSVSSGAVIPQRSNMLVTTGIITPGESSATPDLTTNPRPPIGLAGVMRAFRVYKPVSDTTQISGWKFSQDGTRLWTACVPGATATFDHPNGCSTTSGALVADSSLRNLYTVDGAGNMIAFTTANVATLAPLMNLTATDATAVITAVRNLPLGPIVSSTPAIMNPPSLDPPPDTDYPGFAADNAGRRSIVWVGTNFGILEGIDARLGVEVVGLIPPNLLPKLKTLRDGQPVGNFDYFMDSSPKIADVKYPTSTGCANKDCWHSHLVIGEGSGGTFYQSFDVTMKDMGNAVSSSSDDISAVLQYFSTPRITTNWTFPSYSDFDPTAKVATHCDPVTGKCDHDPLTDVAAYPAFGDLKAAATAVEKRVGQTWSDPAVGEVVGTAGPYVVLVGSGFLPYETQQQANRGGIVAGTTLFILDARTGAVYDSKDVGNDGNNETGTAANNCRSATGGCKQLKNALQADPVSTGPSDSRYITTAYAGDLDGSLWRFDIILDSANSNQPKINLTSKLFTAGSSHDEPIFSSMATVNVGGTQQYIFFGTGSDLLGGSDKNTAYHLYSVLDTAGTGSLKFSYALAKSASGSTVTSDERVTAFPAVAGDIVFFTTTTYTGGSLLYGQSSQPGSCAATPTAKLYAFTFIGGPAYANTGQTSITNTTTPLVATSAGRATAPFIIDQHLAFSVGGQLQMFGDPDAYNNGVGEAGIRVLSWREVR